MPHFASGLANKFFPSEAATFFPQTTHIHPLCLDKGHSCYKPQLRHLFLKEIFFLPHGPGLPVLPCALWLAECEPLPFITCFFVYTPTSVLFHSIPTIRICHIKYIQYILIGGRKKEGMEEKGRNFCGIFLALWDLDLSNRDSLGWKLPRELQGVEQLWPSRGLGVALVTWHPACFAVFGMLIITRGYQYKATQG